VEIEDHFFVGEFVFGNFHLVFRGVVGSFRIRGTPRTNECGDSRRSPNFVQPFANYSD
jgi:hypothetical protein